MIDSSIDQSHSVFRNSRISESLFTPRGFDRTSQHGTAIASILVGSSETYNGMSPASNLYNGVVFATDEFGREFSTTASIVRAINWLAENNVRLINMSLAGPDNAILRRAIGSACARGITLVTAAGNAGPASPPLFPAAYDCTIAVTAVDNDGAPYHRANRGKHIDYALPGINIRHAAEEGTFRESSGTSFAAALLSGLISTRLPTTLGQVSEVKVRLNALATDLGQPGHDPVYGQGAIYSPSTARTSY
jgi:minor extracellular protease Epr